MRFAQPRLIDEADELGLQPVGSPTEEDQRRDHRSNPLHLDVRRRRDGAQHRQERGRGTTSAVQELEQKQGLQCVSIVTLAELIEALSRPPDGRARISAEQLTALRAYQQRYGAA